MHAIAHSGSDLFCPLKTLVLLCIALTGTTSAPAAGPVVVVAGGLPGGDSRPTFSARSERELGRVDPDPSSPWMASRAAVGDWRANHAKNWTSLRGGIRRKIAANFVVEGEAVPVAVLFSAVARVEGSDKRLFARLLVDGSPMHPGDVVLAASESADRRAAQSFEFTGVYERGLHTVEAQWLMEEGGTGFIRDAAILIRQGNALDSRAVLVSVTPASGVNLETQSTEWKDVPGWQGEIVTSTDRDRLTATVSAEASASPGESLWLRVLVDGEVAEPGAVRFVHGAFEGTRTMLFGAPDPAPGNHDIRVQWHASRGGTANLGDRSLTLAVGNSGNQEPLRSFSTFVNTESQPFASYRPVPGMAQNALIPEDSDVSVIFTAEFPQSPGGPVWARLSIGGEPVKGSEVLLANGSTAAGVHAYTFDAKHVGAVSGSLIAPIRVEWRAEHAMATVMAARGMAIHLREHVAPDLAEPLPLGLGAELDRGPESLGVEPVFGERNVLVILFDPHRPGHRVPSIDELTTAFFGDSDSVADYYDKVSGGRFNIRNAGVLGPYDAAHPWEHYWSGPGDHQDKWVEAILAANQDFNFHDYDFDGDRYLSSWDELAIVIVIPQDNSSGFVRALWSGDVAIPVDGVYLDLITEWYVGDPLVDYGVGAHELGHQLLILADLYAKSSSVPSIGTRPGAFCLMDRSIFNQAQHLNPAYKLALGWVTPTIVRNDASVELPDVKESRAVVVLPRTPGRKADEYVVVENRQAAWTNDRYDLGLPDAGLAIWHIIESPIDNANPVVCTTLSTWEAQTLGDTARSGIRLIRPSVSFNDYSALWSSDDYDLDAQILVCPDDGPPRNVLLWSDYRTSYAIRNISGAGPDMTFDIVAP